MDSNHAERWVAQAARRMGAALLLALACTAPRLDAADFDHSHSAYDTVLKAHVAQGRVDYRALKAAPQALNDYLAELAQVPEQQFRKWSKEQQLAYYFNLYNAATLKLIVDHYPVKSIKDIGSLFKGPWDQPVVRLFGKTITLNELEHGILRKDYHEPRLHLALVCAAKGCPPLRGDAYTAEQLDKQLDDQARTYLGSPKGLRIDRREREVRVSAIFKWYGDDFVGKYTPSSGFSGLGKTERAVASFCSKYVSDTDRRYLEAGGYDLEYLDYDWSLNEGGGR